MREIFARGTVIVPKEAMFWRAVWPPIRASVVMKYIRPKKTGRWGQPGEYYVVWHVNKKQFLSFEHAVLCTDLKQIMRAREQYETRKR